MVGDASATVDRAREAIDVLDPDDDLGHGAATALMGLASWRQGDVVAAEAAYAETIRRSSAWATSPTSSAAPSRWPSCR